MESTENAPVQEANEFPLSNSDELKRLKEIVGPLDVEIIDLGEYGYVIHNNHNIITAESPWILVDFDDTGAKTSEDKKTCKNRLLDLGISEDIIKYCDKKSRVDFGERGVIYEPILDKIFLTIALGNTNSEEETKALIDDARVKLLNSKKFSDYPINDGIDLIYRQTRYTSTLYPDTKDTLITLNDYPSGMANNLAIFTYGDPEFQLSKTLPLLKETHEINQIWLTKSKKGDFLKELINKNVFKDLPIHYHYPETDRDVGIPFADPKWQTKLLLFDDDPNQVKNFNKIADELGLLGLGTVRVRREGVKRSEKETEPHNRTMEVTASDTLLDTDLFQNAAMELQIRSLERSAIEILKKFGPEAMGNSDFAMHIEAISNVRGLDVKTVVTKLNEKAGSFIN